MFCTELAVPGCAGRMQFPACPQLQGEQGTTVTFVSCRGGWGQRSPCRNFICLLMENSLLCTHANEGWESCARAPAIALPAPSSSQAGGFHTALTNVTITQSGSPKTCPSPWRCPGHRHGCVPRAALTAHSLSGWAGLCPCPAIHTPIPLALQPGKPC